jgi:hypothetical protein
MRPPIAQLIMPAIDIPIGLFHAPLSLRADLPHRQNPLAYHPPAALSAPHPFIIGAASNRIFVASESGGMADAPDLGSGAARRGGSSPPSRKELPLERFSQVFAGELAIVSSGTSKISEAPRGQEWHEFDEENNSTPFHPLATKRFLPRRGIRSYGPAIRLAGHVRVKRGHSVPTQRPRRCRLCIRRRICERFDSNK